MSIILNANTSIKGFGFRGLLVVRLTSKKRRRDVNDVIQLLNLYNVKRLK